MDLDSRLRAYREACEVRLEQLLPPASERPQELHEAMRYSALAPGKRLRPVLCLAACESVAEPHEMGRVRPDPNIIGAAIDAACALELIHCFSLIHDDLPAIDDDQLRRGRPTCHVRFGEGIAILAGDALFALAFDAIANAPIPPNAAIRAVRVLAEATGSNGLVGGEVVDILTEGKDFVAADLDFIHSRKTGALIAASCEIGAICGGATEDLTAQLFQFGEKIGLAFQVADDILNETSSPEELGKAAGSDRERRKATYPALFGLDQARIHAVRLAEEAKACLPENLKAGLLGAIADYAVERRN